MRVLQRRDERLILAILTIEDNFIRSFCEGGIGLLRDVRERHLGGTQVVNDLTGTVHWFLLHCTVCADTNLNFECVRFLAIALDDAASGDPRQQRRILTRSLVLTQFDVLALDIPDGALRAWL